jgi:Holliday junction resolvase RusA-like endonuclease
MGTVTVEFRVEGDPVGKGRPKFTRSGHTYTPEKTRLYEKKVKQAAWAAMAKQKLTPATRRVSVILACYFAVPKSWSKRKTLEAQCGLIIPSRPDIDNLAKSILDGGNEILWTDDSVVWHLAAFKAYCDEEQEPHVRVKVQWDDPNVTNQDHIVPANV